MDNRAKTMMVYPISEEEEEETEEIPAVTEEKKEDDGLSFLQRVTRNLMGTDDAVKNFSRKCSPQEIATCLEFSKKYAFADSPAVKAGLVSTITEPMFRIPDSAPKWFIDPESSAKLWWDKFILLLVCYNTIFIPYNLAFRQRSWADPDFWGSYESYLVVIDYVIDTFFVFDIVFSFRTGFFDEETLIDRGQKIYDKALIAKRYQKWFWIDLIAVLPFELFSSFTDDFFFLTIASYSKFVRLVRLSKLQKHLDRWESDSNSSGIGIRLFKLLLLFLIIMHLFGCLWWWFGSVGGTNKWLGGPWIEELGKNATNPTGILHADFPTQYTCSIYFALTSMTSVGYGDIVAYTTAERLYSMLVQMVGALAFANLYGVAGSILDQLNASNARFSERLTQYREFVAHHRIGDEMAEQLFAYFKTLWVVKKGLEIESVMFDMPLQTQEEVVKHMYEDVVKNCPQLTNVDDSFIEQFVMGLSQQVCLQDLHIIEEDEIGKEIFVLSRGVMRYCKSMGDSGDEDGEEKDELIVQFLPEGSLIGLYEVLFDSRATCTVRGVTNCDLFSMTRDYFMTIIRDFPDVESYLQTQLSLEHDELVARINRAAGTTLVETVSRPTSSRTFDTVVAVDLGSDEALSSRSDRSNITVGCGASTGCGPRVKNLSAQADILTRKLDDILETSNDLDNVKGKLNALTEYTLYGAVNDSTMHQNFKKVGKKLDSLSSSLVTHQRTLIASLSKMHADLS